MSAGKLVKAGNVIHLAGNNSYITPPNGQGRIPVLMSGNRFMLKPKRTISAIRSEERRRSLAPIPEARGFESVE